MIDKVLQSILQAEREAESVINAANAKAHKIVYDAEAKAAEIRHHAKEQMFQSNADSLAKSELGAKRHIDEILAKSKEKAKAIQSCAADNLDAAADFVASQIMEDLWR